MSDLPVRNCVGCGQVDDHPRDVVALPDGSAAFFHHDCHARLDPPCESCAWLVQHKGDLVGDAWRTQIGLVHNALTPDQHGLHPSETPVVEQFLNGRGV